MPERQYQIEQMVKRYNSGLDLVQLGKNQYRWLITLLFSLASNNFYYFNI
mgnify:CR=1 FL=1